MGGNVEIVCAAGLLQCTPTIAMWMIEGNSDTHVSRCDFSSTLSFDMLTADPINSFLVEDESLERFAGINAISGDLLRRRLDRSRSPGECDLVGRAAMVSNPAALRWP